MLRFCYGASRAQSRSRFNYRGEYRGHCRHTAGEPGGRTDLAQDKLIWRCQVHIFDFIDFIFDMVIFGKIANNIRYPYNALNIGDTYYAHR